MCGPGFVWMTRVTGSDSPGFNLGLRSQSASGTPKRGADCDDCSRYTSVVYGNGSIQCWARQTRVPLRPPPPAGCGLLGTNGLHLMAIATNGSGNGNGKSLESWL